MTDINLEIAVRTLPDTLNFEITNANIFGAKFQAIDPKFQVTRQDLGAFIVARVVRALIRRQVLGTGWKTSKRNFPVTKLDSDFMVIYDPSEK
jgi:hypothetical protein